MKKQGLHIVDGKITTEDGKELILIFRDCAERFEERLKEAEEIVKQQSKYEDLIHFASAINEKGPAQEYMEKWGVK